MTPIPKILREEMANDPYYKTCCVSFLGDCGGRIEWHHVIIHAGKQLQEKWAINPACHDHHMQAEPLREYFEWIAPNRATDQELIAISKAVDYIHKRNYLNEKYEARV
jgi:hypothetical protein